MSAGYGRGFYGGDQLARPRTGSSSSGWFKIATVAGLGAAIWWWVIPAIGPKAKHVAPHGAAPTQETTHDAELDQIARSRGFSSTKAYVDAMIAMAAELRAAGAKVEFSPPAAPRQEGT